MKDMIQDAASLLNGGGEGGSDRRSFLKLAIGTGFAAAALPVVAETRVTTDSGGLTAGEIQIKVDGAAIPVYRAQPSGKSGLPVVLVISEIFGVHEYIADVARRFAKLGYLALAPHLFVRQGDPTTQPTTADLIKNIISKTPDAQVMTDLDAVLAWAGQNGGDTARVGITGFCWGGRITWLYCAHRPQVKAGVAWYGRLEGNRDPNINPRHPIDVAAALKVPVLGLYGAKDTGIPLESVERMKVELAKGTSGSTFVVYPDAGHAFHADYRPSYVAHDAQDGWKRMLAWFQARGVA